MAIAGLMLKVKDVEAQLWDLLSNYSTVIIKQEEKTFPELLYEISSHSTILLKKILSLHLPELLNLKLLSLTKDFNFQIVNFLKQNNLERITKKYDVEIVTKSLNVIKWTHNGLINKIDSLMLLAGVKVGDLVQMSKDQKIEKYYNQMCSTNEILRSYWRACSAGKKPGKFKIKFKMMLEIQKKFSNTAVEFIENAEYDKQKLILTVSVLMLEPIATEYFLQYFETSDYILDLFNLFTLEMSKKQNGKFDHKSEETHDLVNVLWLLFNELSEEEKLQALKQSLLFVLKKLSLLWQWQRFVPPLMKIYETLIHEVILLDLFEEILNNAAYEAGYLQLYLNVWHNLSVGQKEKFVKYIVNNDVDGDRYWRLVDLQLSKVLFNNTTTKKILRENTNLIVERLLRFERFDVVDYWLKEIGLDSVEINKMKKCIMFESRDKCLSSHISLAEKGGEFLVNIFFNWCFASNSEITEEEALKIKEDVVKSFGVKICVIFIKNLDQEGINEFLDWAFPHREDDEKFQTELRKLKETTVKTLAEGITPKWRREKSDKTMKWESENCCQILKNFILWRSSGDLEEKIWEFQKLLMKGKGVISECGQWCKTGKEEPFKRLINFICHERNSPDFNDTVWNFVEEVITETITDFGGSGGFPGEKSLSMFRHLIDSVTTLDDEEIETRIQKLKEELIENEDVRLILSYDIADKNPKALNNFYQFFFDSEDGINLDESVLRETKESVVEEMMDYAMIKRHQMPKYDVNGMKQFFLLGIDDDVDEIWGMKKWFLKKYGADLVFKWVDFQFTSEMTKNLFWLIAEGENEVEAKKFLFTLKQKGVDLLWQYKKYRENPECLQFFNDFFMWTCFEDKDLKEEIVKLRDALMGDDPDDRTPRVRRAANVLTKCLEINKFGKDVEDPSIYKYYKIKVRENDSSDSENVSEDECVYQGDLGFFSFMSFMNSFPGLFGEDESDDEDESEDEDESDDEDENDSDEDEENNSFDFSEDGDEEDDGKFEDKDEDDDSVVEDNEDDMDGDKDDFKDETNEEDFSENEDCEQGH